MCGIAGLFGFKGPIDGLEPLLATMNRAMVHRGPDEEGFHESGPVRLGSRRLEPGDLDRIEPDEELEIYRLALRCVELLGRHRLGVERATPR